MSDVDSRLFREVGGKRRRSTNTHKKGMWRSRTEAKIYIYIYVSEDFLSKVRFLIRVQTEAESFSCLSALTDTFEQQHTSKKPFIYYLGTFHSIHRVNYQISTWNLFSTDINFKSGGTHLGSVVKLMCCFLFSFIFFPGRSSVLLDLSRPFAKTNKQNKPKWKRKSHLVEKGHLMLLRCCAAPRRAAGRAMISLWPLLYYSSNPPLAIKFLIICEFGTVAPRWHETTLGWNASVEI